MTDITQEHEECGKIFEDLLIDEDGRSGACRIYDKLTEDGDCEDCLGENFNQLIHKINRNWFAGYKPTDDHDYYWFTYCYWLYLFVERIEMVFHVLNNDGKSKLFNDFKYKNFKTMNVINKWANFMKHPKEFLFTHWPTYYFEGMEVEINEGDVKVDTAFIMQHYSSDKDLRPIILANNAQVFVQIPDLVLITTKFCEELNVFFDFITENQIVADHLKSKTVIKDTFEQPTLTIAPVQHVVKRTEGYLQDEKPVQE